MNDMPNYAALIAQNNTLWHTAQFKDAMAATASSVAAKICAEEAIKVYKHLEVLTKVPWWVIGVIHYRECGLSWKGSLAQGDPWNQVSRHDPKGRGPFKSFLTAAVDALTNCAPYASKWKDWSPGGALTLLELYNGTGYERHGVPSPYVWSGTQHYRHGKFVRDREYEDDVVDKQLGCAIILHCMQELEDGVMGKHKEATAEVDPNEYPDPMPLPEERPDVPDKPPVLEQVTDKIDQAQQIATPDRVDTVKSLFKSKIAWIQGIAATTFTAILSSAEANPVLWIVAGVAIVVAALTCYFYWHDHGKGSLKK